MIIFLIKLLVCQDKCFFTLFDNEHFLNIISYLVETATLFSINYFNSYKLVTNKQTNEVFALYQCETPVPTNLPAGAKPIQISVNNVAATDTSVIPYLDVCYVYHVI